MTTSTHTLAAPDADLSRRALAGDHDAFQELFRRHEGGLLNVTLRMTGNREDAADITQEAFLRVFARLGTLGERGEAVNLSAYLYRTAKNLVYDHSGRRARELPDEEIERAAGEDDDPETDPERAGLIAAQVAEVRAANARLGERHRLVLALREVEGMGYEDIGEVLGMTPAAVGQLLVRARLALRRELRMEQVDLDALSPAVRDRVGDIAALIDGQLDEDRTQVTERLLASSEEARDVKRRFEEVGERYRMWLPLLPLGLGAGVARAAALRGLLPSGAPRRAAPAGPRSWRSPTRGAPTRTLVVAAGIVVLLLTATTTAVVTMPAPGGGTAPAEATPRAEDEAARAVGAPVSEAVAPGAEVPADGADPAGAPEDPSADGAAPAPGASPGAGAPGESLASGTEPADAGAAAPARTSRGSQEPEPAAAPAPADDPPPATATPRAPGTTTTPDGTESPATTPAPAAPAPGATTDTSPAPGPSPAPAPPADPKDPTDPKNPKNPKDPGTDATPAPPPPKITGPITVTTPIIVAPPSITVPTIVFPGGKD